MHGLAAAVGLVLLIIAVVQMSSAGPAGCRAGDLCDRRAGRVCAVRNARDEENAAPGAHCRAWPIGGGGVCGVAGWVATQLTRDVK